MLRWNRVMIAVFFTVLLPLSAHAQTLELIGGDFTFVHPPVDPLEPDGSTDDALFFSVTGDSFDGNFVAKNSGLPARPRSVSFTGYGAAEGQVYLYPVDGLLATFTGSFTWQTVEGDLHGSFVLLNYPSDFGYPFTALISITFDGGTGRYRNVEGEAIAEGLDFPFGGLGGDLSAAGVVATITQGELRLKSAIK
jgi:hypothetical protein